MDSVSPNPNKLKKVEFMVDNVALEQVSLANSHSTDFSTLIIIYHPVRLQ
jgi:hypothetical protein